jgi:6-phosphogluconolactonase
MRPFHLPLTLLCLASLSLPSFAADKLIYIGTYTNGKTSKGIYLAQLDEETGNLKDVELAAESENPSFLAIHPKKRFVYAVNEVDKGMVSAFSSEARGKLRLLNQVSSRGSAPCHANIDKTGNWLAVANYSSGTAAILPIKVDGSLGESVATVAHKGSSVNPGRQKGPHAHSVNFSADNKFLFVADLGLDQVFIYSFDAKSGSLKQFATLDTPKGAGPRHLALGTNGMVYVLNEMFASVSLFHWTGGPKADLLDTVSAMAPTAKISDSTPNNSGAEVLLHKNGRFLYSSNRGFDTITLYNVAAGPSGPGASLKRVAEYPAGGKIPRGFTLSPDGKFLLAASQNSDRLNAFSIDPKSGALKQIGMGLAVGSPVCVRFGR